MPMFNVPSEGVLMASSLELISPHMFLLEALVSPFKMQQQIHEVINSHKKGRVTLNDQ